MLQSCVQQICSVKILENKDGIKIDSVAYFYAFGNLAGQVLVVSGTDAIQVRFRVQTAQFVQSLYFWNTLLTIQSINWV